MAIFHSTNEYPAPEQGTAVALGFFDGVHLGHRAVLGKCASQAPALRPLALTFAENPLKALGRPSPPYLTDNERKAQRMTEIGIQDIIFEDFSSICALSPGEFVSDILRGRLNAKKVFCGFNYRFGKDGSGDAEALKELCEKYGIEVRAIEPVRAEPGVVSSTRIRELTAAGDIGQANELLGCPYCISGEIDSGNHIGSAMGFPTVNIPIPDGAVVPRYGVYASRLSIDGRSYRGATNIGVHPTVGDNPSPLCETFILDFEGGDLYGKHAVCELLSFIREEKRFDSLEELNAQIKADCGVIEKLNY